MKVKIVVDSTADLRPELLEKVSVVPLSVHFGDRTYVSGVDITPKQFYEMLVESDELPTTSQPAPFLFEEAFEKYDHPLHEEYQKHGVIGAHDGADYLVCRAFIEAVKEGTNTPIDAYDTVAWMAIGPLSEQSIATGGAPVTFPDFTKGKWMSPQKPLEGKYSLDMITSHPETPIVPQ